MLAEGLNPELSLASRYPASPYISGVVEGRYTFGQRGGSMVLIAPFYNLNARNQERSATAPS